MRLYHDSRDPLYRTPCGAQPCGTPVSLRLRITGIKPEKVLLRQWHDEETFCPMHPAQNDKELYEITFTLPDSPTLFWYDFQVWSQGQFYWYGNAKDSLGGEGALMHGKPRSFQITVYDPAFQAPAWTDGAVLYQIFPDRFARGVSGARLPMHAERRYHESWDDNPSLMYDAQTGDNVAHDFFGGTLEGIREKLPYIASLGVTALYLNPIFRARTNHRYDTIDWKDIDPTLGTQEDFRALCRDAKELGIRVILDGVFSHAGSSNPFFLNAQASKKSPYYNWFHFKHWPDEYKSWWGFTTLPEIDKHRPEVVDFFLRDEDAVVKKWLREGAGGWRIDVADELPMDFLRQMRKDVRAAKKDAILVGEVWEDASNKIAYDEMRCYCLGDTVDGVMNYPLREAAIAFLHGRIDANAFKRRMESLYENYPQPFAKSLMNVLGSHDRARTVNVLADVTGEELPRAARTDLRLTGQQRRTGIARLKLMLQLVIAMPGMPCVYYGDEAGMEGSTDPFNRGPFPWGHEDQALTAFFRQSLARRRTVPALSNGSMQIEAMTPDVVCITRISGNQTAYILINRADKAQTVRVRGRFVPLEPLGFRAWEEKDGGRHEYAAQPAH